MLTRMQHSNEKHWYYSKVRSETTWESVICSYILDPFRWILASICGYKEEMPHVILINKCMLNLNECVIKIKQRFCNTNIM
jgi:hypothetical protein